MVCYNVIIEYETTICINQLSLCCIFFLAGCPNKDHLEVLHKYFGHSNFRSIQWEIIRSIIEVQWRNPSVHLAPFHQCKVICLKFVLFLFF